MYIEEEAVTGATTDTAAAETEIEIIVVIIAEIDTMAEVVESKCTCKSV